MSLGIKRVAATSVRLPRVERGVAIRISRYKQEHSVILHPDDFDQLRALDELINDACRLEPLAITEAGSRAHLEEDRSGDPVEDPNALRKLLA